MSRKRKWVIGVFVAVFAMVGMMAGGNREAVYLSRIVESLFSSVYYEFGFGLTKEDKEAITQWRKEAEQGNAEAQLQLGNAYIQSRGVKQDYKEAVKWYRKAADQGNAEVQNALGWQYYRGFGVEKDHQEAFKWWHKSDDQGNATAKKLLEIYVR